jgi:hypothetical protein
VRNFTLIAKDLDVRPALAELAMQPDDHWLHATGDASRFIPLLGGGGERIFEAELPEVWRLIDAVLVSAAGRQGDRGILSYARVGVMPPGSGLPPHLDGIDGRLERRYQVALQSQAGVCLTVGGEARTPQPGEAWWIDASRTHSVTNGSSADRITILFDTLASD